MHISYGILVMARQVRRKERLEKELKEVRVVADNRASMCGTVYRHVSRHCVQACVQTRV